jgi:hypothetical protein
MFKYMIFKWANRCQYKAFSDMPDCLVAFFALSGFLVAGFYGYVLSKTVPEYIEIANKIPYSQRDRQGWFCSILIASLSLMVWFFGSVSLRCNGILHERWYK